MSVTAQDSHRHQDEPKSSTVVTNADVLLKQHYQQQILLYLDSNFNIIYGNSYSEKFFAKYHKQTTSFEHKNLWHLFASFSYPLQLNHEKLALANYSPLLGEMHQLSQELGINWHLLPHQPSNRIINQQQQNNLNNNQSKQHITYLFIAEPYYIDADDQIIRKITQQKVAAEEANQTKLDFMANMSHELRNSLNGILGMTQILSLRNLPSDSQNYLKDIHHSGEHLLTLVRDMLDFTKLEAGQLAISLEPVNLRKLISDIIDSLAKQCEQKNLDIFLDYADNIPRSLISDGNRLRQIVLNLVTNAIKFTPSGHVLIAVECLQQKDDTVLLQIIIEDTGIGIPQDKVHEIFNRYTQARNQTRSTKTKGTGLGLAIVKQLVERMGGEIGINSQLNHGATFWLNLPFKRYQPKHTNVDEQINTPNLELSILVIDDNLKRGKILLKQVLGKRNKAIKSKNALDLLLELSQQKLTYDIILIDDQIDFPNGATGLVEAIKPVYTLDQTLWCLVTQASRQNQAEFNQQYFFHQIFKPVNPALFAQSLMTAWQRWTAELDVKATQKTIKAQQISILLVEDNLINQKVASIMLSDLGCTVSLAENGEQTIQQILARKFDLIFLDIGLPDTDGCSLAKFITEQPNPNQKVPIIALTAHVLSSDKETFLASGMRDVVTKPITFDSAKKALLKWAPQD